MNNWYRNRSLFARTPVKQRPKQKWRIRHVIWTAIKRTCMAIGAMVLFSAIMGTTLSVIAMKDVQAPTLPHEIVLYFPLDTTLVEHQDTLGPYGFQEKFLTARNMVNALDHAATDERVKGFVTVMKGGAVSLAHSEELRAAIHRFRASGKFAYIYGQSYEGLGQYYLASAFDEIWLQPQGIVSIPGIQMEMPYARNALDKMGIEPQVFARKEYKNLFESATDTEMSPESREMMTAIVRDVGDTLVSAIAADRAMDEGALKALVDKGLYTDDLALQAKLIDKLNYGDVFTSTVKELVTGDPEADDKLFVAAGRYIKDMQDSKALSAVPVAGSKKPKVALIYVAGQIVQRDESGSNLAAAESAVSSIRKAADDENVKAIVLRIDSPGGSPTAAETIRRAIVKAKEKGKPVIVSMGASAASGGYWIAADADRIFALSTTFTGSIGVTGGKFSLEQMWSKLGINWDHVSWGENAGLWSFNEPYSPTEAARMNILMDNVYDNFVKIVAEGRDMNAAEVDKVAGGRVWTGRQGVGAGLVDEVGGLNEALDYAAVSLGALSRDDLRINVMPRPKTAFERIIELLDTQVRMSGFFKANAGLLEDLSAAIRPFHSAQHELVLAR